MIEIVLASIAANAVVLGALGFLFKSIISHYLDKDISNYKAKLETERLRLQISYGGIFEKQANAIIHIYKLVHDFDNKIKFIANAIGGEENKNNFRESYKNLYEYYEENRILLPEIVEEHFHSLLNNVYFAANVVIGVNNTLEKPYLLSDADFTRLFSRQDKAQEIIDQLPNIKAELRGKLRTLIGVSQQI